MSTLLYADFACPYCYIESEQLEAMGQADAVEFRPVSLLPEAPVPWDPNDPLVIRLLDEGWDAFLERSEGIPVARPESLPNTRLAARAVAHAYEVAPERVADLRRELFRALWRNGRDLGKPEEIHAIWNQLDLPPLNTTFPRASRHLAKVWQINWREGPFTGRVPVLSREPQGERLLGLPTPTEIREFLAQDSDGAPLPDACRVR